MSDEEISKRTEEETINKLVTAILENIENETQLKGLMELGVQKALRSMEAICGSNFGCKQSFDCTPKFTMPTGMYKSVLGEYSEKNKLNSAKKE